MQRARPALILLLVVLGAAAAAAGLRLQAVREAEDRLRAAGLRWESREDRLLVVRWRGLRRPGVEIGLLRWTLAPTPAVYLDGVRVDLGALSGVGTGTTDPRDMALPADDWDEDSRGDASGADSSSIVPRTVGASADSSPIDPRVSQLLADWLPGADPAAWAARVAAVPAPVTLGGADVNWGGQPLLDGLRGSLAPTVALAAPAGALRLDARALTLEIARDDLRLGPVSGAGRARLELRAGAAEAQLEWPEARMDHPLLAPAPLGPWPVRARGAWDGAALAGELQAGPLRVPFSGTIGTAPPRAALSFDSGDVPLETLLVLFGDAVPEGRRVEVRGSMGLRGTVSWPDGTWALTPRAEGLAVAGALPDPDGLKRGRIEWRAPGPGPEDWQLAATGEDTATFVSLDEAGLFPDAAVVAEDGAFPAHRGWHLPSVQEALDAAAAGRPLRGGSTLSQQLAKNLFLDGRDRSLARKLRELLYALEMERVLGKRRILELYVNVVELGPGVFGIGPGAEAWFARPPARLTPREAAFLAACLPGPRRCWERTMIGGREPRARVDRVLELLAARGHLSPAVAETARRDTLRPVPPAR